MSTTQIVIIVVIVVVVLIVLGLLAAAAAKRRRLARHDQAIGMRTQAATQEPDIRRHEAGAAESEAQARKSRAEADEHAARAQRAEAEATERNETARQMREEQEEHLRRADHLDPEVGTEEHDNPAADHHQEPVSDGDRGADTTVETDQRPGESTDEAALPPRHLDTPSSFDDDPRPPRTPQPGTDAQP